MEALRVRQLPATQNGSEYNVFYSSRPSATPATKYFHTSSSSSTCPTPSAESQNSFKPPLWLYYLRDILSRQAEFPSQSSSSSSSSTSQSRRSASTSLSSGRRFDRASSTLRKSSQPYKYTIHVMPRKNARPRSQPAPAFHMSTRRRASQKAVAADAAPATPEPFFTATPTSAHEESQSVVSSVSSLTTLDSQVDFPNQPDPLITPTKSRKRKAAELEVETANSETTKTSTSSTVDVSSSTSARSRKRKASELESEKCTLEATETTRESTADVPSSTPATSLSVNQDDRVDHDSDFEVGLTHEQWKNKRYWPRYNDKRRIYYGADAKTRYKPGSQRPSQNVSPANGSPRRPARGGRVGRGRGGGNLNGNGRGRGRGRARGGRDDSPEPPRKRVLTEVEDDAIRLLKARQQELKRVFNTIGAQQIDILESLASRDINKLCRKPKAHKNVPEYEDVLEELEQAKAETQALLKKRYDYFIEQENSRFEQEKELLEMQCEQRCRQIQQEHLRGINGDINLLKKAHAFDEDDDRTEHGSERDITPFHHEAPESNTRARGYTSAAVRDEKSFREYIESEDDYVRQELMQEEAGPLLELIAKMKKKRQAEIDREKTQNMPALVEEANHRLEVDKIGGYLIPKPLTGAENQAYGLSALADVADWVAQQHPHQNYIFMPLSPGHHFPRNALNFDPLPGQRPLAPAPYVAPPPVTAPVHAPIPAQRPQPPYTPHAQKPSREFQPIPIPFSSQQKQQPPASHKRQPSRELQPSLQPYRPDYRSLQQQPELRPLQQQPEGRPEYRHIQQQPEFRNEHPQLPQQNDVRPEYRPPQQQHEVRQEYRALQQQPDVRQEYRPLQQQPDVRQEYRPLQQQPEVRAVPSPYHHEVQPAPSPHHEARPAPPYPFQAQPPPQPLPQQQYSHPPHRPTLNVQTSMNGIPPSHSRQSSLSTPVTPHIVSTGPGQPIAPAPPKPAPISMPPSPYRRATDQSPYRQLSYPPVRPALPAATQSYAPGSHASPRSALPPPSPFPQPPPHPIPHQNFIFQPPQQPPQHHPAPPPASLGSAWVPRYSVPASPNSNNPNISSITTHGLGGGHQGKIPVTFVNQTVASRKAAAAAKVGHRGGRGGDSVDGNGKERKGSASGSASRSASVDGEGVSEQGSRPSSAGIGEGGRRERGSIGGGVRMLLPKTA